jgi:CHASE3 domain sensor protein
MTIKKKMTAGFGLLLLLLVAIGLIVWNNMSEVHEKFSAVVQHDAPVIAKANRLLKLVVDMETGQRGFCITQNEAFLEPYTRAQREFGTLMANEKRLIQTPSRPGQGPREDRVPLSASGSKRRPGLKL